jgi:hypothetical protein
MQKLTLIIVTTAVALGLRGLAPGPAAVSSPQPAGASLSPAMLRLEYDWQRREGSRGLHTYVRGLVTAVGPHTLLTHNHYPAGFSALTTQNLTLTDAAGNAVTVPVAAISLQPLDAGTLLVQLPRDITLDPAALAAAGDVQSIAPGDWLTIQYWADQVGTIGLAEFEVVALGPGTATLADPALIINGGDSGGGAYHLGRLVGNTWSINTDHAGQPQGRFNVALLPTSVSAARAAGHHRADALAQPPVAALSGLPPTAQ